MTASSKVSGIVQIDGTPARRTVRAFGYESTVHYINGVTVNQSMSLGHATSDPDTGEYTIYLMGGYYQPIFVVAFDDYGKGFSPALAVSVGDRVHPSIPNGYVWECVGAGTLPETEPEWVIDTETAQLYGTASMIARPFYRPMVHGPVMPEVTAYSSISGGDLVYDVDIDGVLHTVHEFTQSGELVVTGIKEVTLLVVGGGGSGGGGNTGGGGGGGGVVLTTHTFTEGTYDVVVGRGGDSPGAIKSAGNPGEDSSVDGVVAYGGGAGGGGGAYDEDYYAGGDGGCGGGGGGSYRGTTQPGGIGSQGGNGASGVETLSTYSRRGGGGGGAGGDGSGAMGGPGMLVSITGEDRYFGGGGGGGSNGSHDVSGGIGGGGSGGQRSTSTPPSNGEPNTGGGGGGMYENGAAPGSGGSGIVIIVYPKYS